MARLLLLSAVFASAVGCGTCTGDAPTCDAPATAPNAGDYLADEVSCSACVEAAPVTVRFDEVELEVTDDDGNVWLVNWAVAG